MVKEFGPNVGKNLINSYIVMVEYVDGTPCEDVTLVV